MAFRPRRISAEPIPCPCNPVRTATGLSTCTPNQPSRCVEQAAREHHVANDFFSDRGDERQPVARRPVAPQPVDERGHDSSVITERRQVKVPHSSMVGGLLAAKVHQPDRNQ